MLMLVREPVTVTICAILPGRDSRMCSDRQDKSQVWGCEAELKRSSDARAGGLRLFGKREVLGVSGLGGLFAAVGVFFENLFVGGDVAVDHLVY